MKIIELKKHLRRAIAQKELMLKNLTGLDRMDILNAISLDKNLLRAFSKNASDRFPIFSDLITVLSDNEDKVRAEYKENPSENLFKRWALRAATLEYYSELNFGVDQKIISVFGNDKLDDNYAPNQKQIYNKWLKLLTDGVKNKSITDETFSEAAEKGFGRGSSFEKQLDRYREDFVKEIWYKLSEE